MCTYNHWRWYCLPLLISKAVTKIIVQLRGDHFLDLPLSTCNLVFQWSKADSSTTLGLPVGQPGFWAVRHVWGSLLRLGWMSVLIRYGSSLEEPTGWWALVASFAMTLFCIKSLRYSYSFAVQVNTRRVWLGRQYKYVWKDDELYRTSLVFLNGS